MSCATKMWFGSKKSAQIKVNKLKRAIKTRLVAYHCPKCGGYHLTSKTKMGYKMKVRAERDAR